MNVPGFKYGKGGEFEREWIQLDKTFKGFINHYSTSALEEDRAEVYQEGSNRINIDNIINQENIIQPIQNQSPNEEEISKNLKEAYFDYSIISLGILNKQDRKIYEKGKSNCDNLVKRSLYHGTQIDPISKILTTDFKYTKKDELGKFNTEIEYSGDADSVRVKAVWEDVKTDEYIVKFAENEPEIVSVIFGHDNTHYYVHEDITDIFKNEQ